MPQNAIKLIVGLGNPSAEYEKTRHNAGAWFAVKISELFNATLRPEKKFQGNVGTVKIGADECRLMIPSTFMNLSGQAIKAIMTYYKLSNGSLLVAHDDLDLPAGTVKLKFNGGHGGHNGLRDIINHLGTQNFYRLRLGIGHPGHRDKVHDYVLH